MARLPYISDEDATDDQRAVIDARKAVFGRDSAFQRMVTRTPRVAGWFLPFSLALQREGTGGLLDGRIKELVILMTSRLNACSFCAAHNTSLGQAVGLTMEQIDALSGDYQSSTALTDRDKAAVRWAEVVTKNEARRDNAAFEGLKRHFTDDEIVELTWVIGLFNMVNRITDSLWLDVEEKDVEGIRKPADEAGILEFVGRMVTHIEGRSVNDSGASMISG